LENLSWAIKYEMEMGCPSGGLFLDGLALSFASRLVTQHCSTPFSAGLSDQLNGNRLKRVLSFIEEEISTNLQIQDIAKVAGVGPSRLRTLFRL
jgi:AraC family transcriptional regulator